MHRSHTDNSNNDSSGDADLLTAIANEAADTTAAVEELSRRGRANGVTVRVAAEVLTELVKLGNRARSLVGKLPAE